MEQQVLRKNIAPSGAPGFPACPSIMCETSEPVSVDGLATPSVGVAPERIQRTGFAFRIIDAFLMRTPDDAIDRYDRSGAMMVDEPDDLFGDGRIGPRIAGRTKPPPNGIGLRTFVRDDPD
ncbi:hypothetical protein [Paraburkholderia hospita]|uniref:hypothetical protein n=1 Tax=Paraburkholderia hospita TaxID=169430 RepID=UPI00140450E7|nr:hypothetical protein [Paraburkholderia hospita]